MKRRWQPFLHVAGLTAVELMRQPVTLLLVTTIVLFIGLLPFLITHTLGEAGKVVRDSALAVQFVGALLFSVAAAGSALNREVRQGTAGAVLTKPIGRGAFLAAKFAGVSLVMLLFVWMSTLMLVVADRAGVAVGIHHHGPESRVVSQPMFLAVAAAYLWAGFRNYQRRQPFVSTAFLSMAFFLPLGFAVCALAGGDGPHAEELVLRWSLLPACVLQTFSALMLQALALACATRVSTVPTLVLCTTGFLLGLMSDFLFLTRDALWAKVFYALVPNWQQFWMADALTAGGTIPWVYVAQAAGYGLTWTGGLLLLAMVLFDRMEVR